MEDRADDDLSSGTELRSLQTISTPEKKYPETQTNTTKFAKEITLGISRDCLIAPNVISTGHSDVSENIKEFLESFDGFKIVDRKSAQDFSVQFELEADISDDINSNYRDIYKKFQDKFKIRMAFVEVMHRAYAIFIT